VISENRDKADEAIVKIKADYSFDEMKVSDKTFHEFMLKADSRVNVARTTGDIDAGRQICDKVFESEYHDPYLAHAAIEPHTALAQLENGKMTVYAATQSPFGLQDGIVRELGFTRENVRVITPLLAAGSEAKVNSSRGSKLPGLLSLPASR